MSVRIIVMKTGEQLIAETTENLDDTLLLKQPLLIVMAAPGKIGFVDYLPYAKTSNGITLRRSDVLLVLEAQEDANNHYAEITGGGLMLPEKKVASNTGLKLVT